MPSRQTLPGSRGPRRRPSPAAGGGWIWLILLATVVAILFFIDSGPPVINNSDFWKLLEKDQISEVLVTPDRITGEVKDPESWPEELQPIRKELRNGKKFAVRRQGTEDKGELGPELRKHKVNYREEASSQWIMALVVFVLPVLVILGLFFFFIFPRIRDP